MKSYKRTFLTDKSADSYLRWDIQTYEGKKSKSWSPKPTLDVQLKIADCTRMIHLDFGIGYNSGAKAMQKLRRFREFINEFCDRAEEGYTEHERNCKEYANAPKTKD